MSSCAQWCELARGRPCVPSAVHRRQRQHCASAAPSSSEERPVACRTIEGQCFGCAVRSAASAKSSSDGGSRNPLQGRIAYEMGGSSAVGEEGVGPAALSGEDGLVVVHKGAPLGESIAQQHERTRLGNFRTF